MLYFGRYLLVVISIATCQAGCGDSNRLSPPVEWSAALGGKTIRELHLLLGPPQEDGSAKQFQNWVLQDSSGGQKILKVLCPNRSAPDETPAEVYYFACEQGSHKPVLVRRLSP